MEVLFYPQDEEEFKKEAVGNFVYTKVTNLSTNEIFIFSRKVTKLWTASCRNNIVTDHRIKALEGSNYRINSWIESSGDMTVTREPDPTQDESDTTCWLASSDPSFYDSIAGFQKYSEIDWGNISKNKIEVGDIVYIYITKPKQKIAIKTEVTKSGYGRNELLGGKGQINRDGNDDVCEDFIRLKLLHFIDSNFLGIDYLHQNGINGNIQGKRRVTGHALTYIQFHEGSNQSGIVLLEEMEKELEDAIVFSRYSSPNDRANRLDKAKKIPEQIEIRTRGFKRNADVIVTVLDRANGICERCNQKAPFVRKKDNTPFLEVHHKKQLSEGGEDSVENAIAICPNCHRELHFGV